MCQLLLADKFYWPCVIGFTLQGGTEAMTKPVYTCPVSQGLSTFVKYLVIMLKPSAMQLSSHAFSKCCDDLMAELRECLMTSHTHVHQTVLSLGCNSYAY